MNIEEAKKKIEDCDTSWYCKEAFDTLLKENERLNNIINELEKDLEDKYYGRGKYAMDSEVIGIIEVLNKLQELKGGGKNE